MPKSQQRPKPLSPALPFAQAVAEQHWPTFDAIVSARVDHCWMGLAPKVLALSWVLCLRPDPDGWVPFPSKPVGAWLGARDEFIGQAVFELKRAGLIQVRADAAGRPLRFREVRYTGPCPLAGR